MKGASDPENRRPTVVIVDDHPGYARGLKQLLESEHPSIIVLGAASRPHAGLELVTRHQPDAVLVDVRMPQMSGIELAAEIRASSPSSRVLMLTVSEDPEDVRACLRAGAVGYLSKDLEPGHIAAAVELAVADVVLLSPPAFNAAMSISTEAAGLSAEELRLLRLAASGANMNEIAAKIAVSRATATRSLGQLQRRLGVANRDQLIALAARRGWV